MKYLSFLCVFLIACSKQPSTPKTTTFSGVAMTMPYKIIIGKNLDAIERKKLEESIEKTFSLVNKTCNNWNEDSEISHFNKLSAYEKCPISFTLKQLFDLVDVAYKLSHHRFDPTVAPLASLWQHAKIENRYPLQSEIDAITPSIGWHTIHFTDGIFYKEHSDTQIDLCGIAKGYAIDLLAEQFTLLGYSDYFIEWAGEIKAMGKNPNRGAWIAAIAGPTGAIYSTIPLSAASLATSGDYINFWKQTQEDNVLYSHIYDTKNLSPMNVLQTALTSASVLSQSCALADALATTCMSFSSLKEAQKWSEEVQRADPSYVFWLFSK